MDSKNRRWRSEGPLRKARAGRSGAPRLSHQTVASARLLAGLLFLDGLLFVLFDRIVSVEIELVFVIKIGRERGLLERARFGRGVGGRRGFGAAAADEAAGEEKERRDESIELCHRRKAYP